MEIVIAYFAFGAGLYIGMSLKFPEGFSEASAADLIRGVLIGFVFWPIGLIAQLLYLITEDKI